MHPFRFLLSFHCVYVCRWEHMHFCSCKWKGQWKTSQKPALPTRNTQIRTSRKTRHSQAFRLSCSLYVFHTVSLSFSLSFWGVIIVVGSSRVGKRFSFSLSLPPSKLCTGYYRDLFTKCSFCLFLSSPLCPQSLHFSLQFSAAPSILFETQCVSLCTDWCLHPPVLLFLP